MTQPDRSNEALYRGTWLPCRVLQEDTHGGQFLVKVADDSGLHHEWVTREKVRKRATVPELSR